MNYVVLRKTGGFYSAYDDSALIIGYLCNYKVKNGKTGFPLSSIDKVLSILDSYKISYIVKDKDNEIRKKDYKKSNKYDIYLKRSRIKNSINNRINNIVKEMNDLPYNKLEELLTIIEEFIYEK